MDNDEHELSAIMIPNANDETSRIDQEQNSNRKSNHNPFFYEAGEIETQNPIEAPMEEHPDEIA